MTREQTIAHDLLSIGAVFLRPDEPFTWASGIKSPVYCDNRLTLTAPEVRGHVEEGLVDLICKHYPNVEVLMGTSTAGIAHAAIVGHLMGLPMGYVRSSGKDHGRRNRIKSPVYCDNRLTLTAPSVRTDVETALAETIKREYPEAEVLMGTSTAGIAHAAITAHIMGLPMGYVRSGSKDHGRQNQIEGRLEKGQKVVVVEDLISTGGSVIEVVNVLREAGAEVLGVVSIFTYGMQKGVERLAAAGVKNVSLTNFDVVAQAAAEEHYIRSEDIARLIAFRDNPSDESWMEGGSR